MRVDAHEVICQLRKEKYRIRLMARPSREATIEPMSHGVVPCTVENREPPPGPVLGVFKKKTASPGLVTETVWWPPEGIQIPPALVNNGQEVMVPCINLSTQPLVMGVSRVIAILDEAEGETVEMGTGKRITESPNDSLGLPEFLEDLCRCSTQILPEESDHQLIRYLLSGFQDIFMGPDWDNLVLGLMK
eukprot:GHVU01223202.1.p1 GENE.GHVU01223202.1~~GHVU01223202.1.p1  ORF type:complete len:190 (-),score=8.47 GHVU01223202.1:407-976(-)